MKNYFNRLLSNSKPWQICIWWLFRIPLIVAFVMGFFKSPFDITDPLQVFANLVGMFAWEIFMAFPEKSLFRHVPSYVQIISVVGLFLASFCGKFLNFYYDVFWWDAMLHALGGAEAVIIGYEVMTAMQKRDKLLIKPSYLIIGAVGLAFVFATAWELFEFTFDQVACVASSGNIFKAGDAQHWSITLAEGTAKAKTLIPPVYPERWAIMDTMGDIVLNTIGSIAAYIALTVFPYHHKGKGDINALYERPVEKKTASV